MGPSILVVRLSSIGDLVHTLPAVAALRQRFPEARIDWLVETRHREVLLDNPDVSGLIEVDTLGSSVPTPAFKGAGVSSVFLVFGPSKTPPPSSASQPYQGFSSL